MDGLDSFLELLPRQPYPIIETVLGHPVPNRTKTHNSCPSPRPHTDSPVPAPPSSHEPSLDTPLEPRPEDVSRQRWFHTVCGWWRAVWQFFRGKKTEVGEAGIQFGSMTGVDEAECLGG
ncbi:MAG: hypothetical protein MMC33_006229 [Icmadophila ericetorum]|nr:hypothetical protein [Icmadophila ericetorum]